MTSLTQPGQLPKPGQLPQPGQLTQPIPAGPRCTPERPPGSGRSAHCTGEATRAEARRATTSIGAPGRAKPLRLRCSSSNPATPATVSSWLWPA